MSRRSAENAIDWDAIERKYRLGQKSNKQLAEAFGVSASSIGRRAEKYGWVVDKSQEVAAKRNSLLIQNASGNANPNATPSRAEIQVAAQTEVEVVLGHRKGLCRISTLRDKLIAELEAVTDNIDMFQQVGELCRSESDNGVDRINDLYHRVISLPDRVDTAKKLAEIDEKVRKGEREAFSIKDDDDKANAIDELLLKINREQEAEGA
jgi:hypothetical protein